MTSNTSLTLSLSPTAGSLEQYIQSVHRIPMLSEEEEQELATRLRENEDVEAARRLVLSHLRVVVTIARSYLGYGLPHSDLIQEGNVGLMKAVRRFDPKRGVRLFSFAVHWIKAEIHEFIIRNWRIVKIATTKAQRKLFFNLRSFKTESDNTYLNNDEIQALATQLGVNREDVIEMETRLRGQSMSLDSTPADDETETEFTPIKYLAHPSLQPDEQLEQAQLDTLYSEKLKEALLNLDERSRDIIAARWLQEENQATLHELAAKYNVSAERIRQIEQKAMQTLRTTLAKVEA